MESVYLYKTASGERRYRVTYRDANHVQHTKRGFRTLKTASEYLTSVKAQLATGGYVDPRGGDITIAELEKIWVDGHKAIWTPSYSRSIDSTWRTHVEEKWGDRKVRDVKHSEIQLWISELAAKRSPTIVYRAFGILKAVFELAESDERIVRKPTDRIKLPPKNHAERPVLTAKQVIEVANASGDNYRALVLTLGFCGLRWGEATGLLVQDLDFERKRIHVKRSATKVGPQIIIGPVKNKEERYVPMFRIVEGALRLKVQGKRPTELVFTDPDGAYCRQQSISPRNTSWYSTALKKAGVPLVRIHDLRHTAASIAIASSASPKGVQRMLGHSSATMTLDVYTSLTEHETDRIRENVDKLAEEYS